MMKIFGAKAPSGTPKTQKRSVFGLLFNPRLGDSIRPMGQAFSGFVTMIAMVFAMNGLFPKNHPALKGEPNAPTLSLPYILQTAWSGLSFTRAGLPKVLLFFAVATALVLSVLSIITALMLGFVSHAHAAAAAGGAFASQNPTTDLAINWIDFLFNPTYSAAAASNLNASTGLTMPSSTIQTALWTALGVYSGAMLIIAGLILFYHLAAMIAETAHSGVPMGKKANQIWAPIRLVIAVGLLVPINGTTLNSGQYIVIYLAEAGSALASNVWGNFVQTLTTDSKAPPVETASDVGSSGLVYNMSLMYGCEYAYNYHIYEQETSNVKLPLEYINQWPWVVGGPPAMAAYTPGQTANFSNDLENGYALCGSFTVPTEPQMSDPVMQPYAHSVYQAVTNAFNTLNKTTALEGGLIQATMLSNGEFADVTPAVAASPLGPESGDIPAMEATYSSAITKSVAGLDLGGIVDAMATDSNKRGWLSAGAWFNELSSVQTEANEALQESLPSAIPPSFGKNGGPTTQEIQSHESNEQVGWHISRATNNQEHSLSAYNDTNNDLAAFAGILGVGPPSVATNNWDPKTGCTGMNPVACILSVVLDIGENEGVWHDYDAGATPGSINMGVQFSGIYNPLMEMSQYGHNSIQAGIQCFNLGIGAIATSAVSSVFSFLPLIGSILKGLSAIASVLSGGFFFFGVLFFTIGVVLAFVVPLLPFMHFFFQTITWITCVAEAIIGIPLVALAHLSPEGEGIAGQAKGAYQMIFSVLLRPVLMVFGLICAILVLFVAVGLINALYAVAVAGAGAGGIHAAHMAISRIMFTVIYVAMIYSIANHSFRLISRLPDHAMEWLGGKGLRGEQMGDPGHINQGIGLASGYLGGKASEQLQGAGKALTTSAGNTSTAIQNWGSEEGKDQGKDSIDSNGAVKQGSAGRLTGPARFVRTAGAGFAAGQKEAKAKADDNIWKQNMLEQSKMGNAANNVNPALVSGNNDVLSKAEGAAARAETGATKAEEAARKATEANNAAGASGGKGSTQQSN